MRSGLQPHRLSGAELDLQHEQQRQQREERRKKEEEAMLRARDAAAVSKEEAERLAQARWEEQARPYADVC